MRKFLVVFLAVLLSGCAVSRKVVIKVEGKNLKYPAPIMPITGDVVKFEIIKESSYEPIGTNRSEPDSGK